MKYSVVQFSELQRGKRIDADYYLPEFIEVERILQKHNSVPLSSFCFSCKKGIFDISPDNYRDIGVPLIRTSEIKDPLINFSTTVFLEESIHHSFEKTELKSGDLVFTKIGAYIGDVAVLPRKYQYYNFSQNVAGCSIKQKLISSKYILAFLLSKLGRDQILRVAMLSGQGKLELDDIRDIRIPVLDRSFQVQIESVIDMAEKFRDLSLSVYSQAESILLTELGLLEWKPKHQLSFVKKYSDSVNAERFDAEYFQPKYEEIITAVKNYKGGFDLIKGQFGQNKKTIHKIDDRVYKYIEIGCVNISDGKMEPMNLKGSELPANAKIKLQKDDVIVSKVRPYRGAIGIVDCDNYVGSGAFTVLHENGVVSKETLMLFLRLKPLLDFSLKFNTGTSYPTITDDDILNFPLPKISLKIQEQIKEKIVEMQLQKRKSLFMLEIAKQGVEMAIEKSEEEAMAWLKENLDKIAA